MKNTVRICLATFAVFLIGLLTGIWSQRMHLLPPPPLGPLDEFSTHGPHWRGPDGRDMRPEHLSPEKWAQIREEMEKIRPEFEAFQAKLEAIETDFRTKVDAMLTPEQRKLLPQMPGLGKRGIGEPMSQHGPPFMGPMEGIAIFTIIKPALDNMSRELNLTAPQQATLRQLLLERRQKFLDLVDTAPPPSIKLGRMLHEQHREMDRPPQPQQPLSSPRDSAPAK